MRGLLVTACVCLLVSCSDDDAGVAGPGTSSGGASARGGSGAAGSSSGGASGGAGTGSRGAGGAGAPSCNGEAPLTGQLDAPRVDLPIAPVAPVKHGLAIEHSASLGGFAVAHVTAIDGSPGLTLQIVSARPQAGALAVDAAIRVTDDTAPVGGNAGWPSIAANSDGSELLVVWGDDRQGSGIGPIEIMGQFFQATATGLTKRGANFLISTQPATNDWRPRAVWVPGAERFWVAWADDRLFDSVPGGRYLFARGVDLDGSLGAELELADRASWQDGVIAAASAGRVLFVWGQADESVEPFMGRHRARFVDAQAGQSIGLPFTLFERAGVVLAPASAAWDAVRCRYLVAWQESDNRQIWGMLLDANATAGGAPFQITNEPAGAGSPHIAWSSATQSFVLAYGTWESSDAFVVELDANGKPRSTPRSMHAVPPTNGTYLQDIATGAGRALAISNEDYMRIEGALMLISGGA